MDRSERISLSVSTAGHVLLIGALSVGLLHWRTPRPLRPPSIDVALTDEIALKNTVAKQAAAALSHAPEIGPSDDDAIPSPPIDLPKPVELKIAPPKPKPEGAIEPQAPKKIDTARLNKAISSLKSSDSKTPARAPRLGDDFLKGLDSSPKQLTADTPGAGTAQVDEATKRALDAEIRRRIKPYWNSPSGPDADRLVTVLRVTLTQDGALVGAPEVVSQSGVTTSNVNQKQLHAERAIRAVTLAAPFKLPPELYEVWHSFTVRFDKRLSQ